MVCDITKKPKKDKVVTPGSYKVADMTYTNKYYLLLAELNQHNKDFPKSFTKSKKPIWNTFFLILMFRH